MQDIDAVYHQPLLPVSEETSSSYQSQAEATAAGHLTDPHQPGTAAGDAQLPHGEDQLGTSVQSSYHEEVKEQLRLMRECDVPNPRQS